MFPSRIPTLDDPEPPVHTLEDLKLPCLILELFKVNPDSWLNHIWDVKVRAVELSGGRVGRDVEIWHNNQLVDKSKSKLR